MGTDSTAVERGNADAPSKSQDKQDAKPFTFKKELDDFSDKFHILVEGKVYRVRRGSPYSVHRTTFSIESNTPIGL